MNSLRELEQRLYRAIVLEEAAELPLAGIVEKRRMAARLEVYRNNARETFRRTLAVTYPVIERLVGEACFRSLARAYMRDFPSRSGDLAHFGMEFPSLLAIWYRDTEFAYLTDVASLERALAEANDAEDCAPLDVAGLAAIDAADCAQLRFACHPATRFLCSRFPVYTLWHAHRTARVESVDLRVGAEHVLVARTTDGAVAHLMAPADFAFARSLADGDTLEDAVDAGAALSPAFEPGRVLAALVGSGVLTAFSLSYRNII